MEGTACLVGSPDAAINALILPAMQNPTDAAGQVLLVSTPAAQQLQGSQSKHRTRHSDRKMARYVSDSDSLA